jgi:DNA polymerase-3 subunit delta'
MEEAPLFAEVPGQARALGALRDALAKPVHAYLLLGPQGSGAMRAARDFAAALLCSKGGCGCCSDCTRARAGIHPDLTIAEREGATYRVEDMRQLTRLAQRRPLEAARTVIVIPEAQLMARAAPAMLKTLEEPPASTVFVLVADDLPSEMITIRSRCVEIDFEPLSRDAVVGWLVDQGIDQSLAEDLAEGAGGDADRALLLARDPSFADRLELWKRVPELLDGSGSKATGLAVELNESLSQAVAPLVELHKEELARLEGQAEAMGSRGLPGRKELLDRFKREERRYQTTELLAGLAVLARRYRDCLAAAERQGGDDAPERMRRSLRSIDAISRFAAGLRRNPRQLLALERLFLELS